MKITPIQKSTLLIIFITAMVKIPLVLRDIAMAGYFGVNKTMDLFLYALVVPTFLAAIVIASLNYFFIPSYLKIKTSNGKDQARHYITQLFAMSLIGVIIFVLLTSITVPHILVRVNPKLFTIPDLIGPFTLFYFLLSIFAGLQIISLILTFLLQAEHKYINSLFPQALAPTMSLIFILVFGKSWGIISVIYGGLIGIMFGLSVLYITAYQFGLIGALEFKLTRPQIPINFNSFLVLNFAFLLPALTALIDQQMAVSLGDGKLSTLTYGLRIPDGIAEILCAGLGTAVFSHFSEWSAQNDRAKLVESLQKVILFSTLAIIPISIFLYLYAQPIVSVLFERGVFDLSATMNVSRTLQFSCFSIYFVVLATVGAKMIAAIGKNKFFLPFSIIFCSLKILLNITFIKFWNLNGIALATVIMQLISCLLIYTYLQKKGISVSRQTFVNQLLKILIFIGLFHIILMSIQNLTHSIRASWSILIAALYSVIIVAIAAKVFLQNHFTLKAK